MCSFISHHFLTMPGSPCLPSVSFRPLYQAAFGGIPRDVSLIDDKTEYGTSLEPSFVGLLVHLRYYGNDIRRMVHLLLDEIADAIRWSPVKCLLSGMSEVQCSVPLTLVYIGILYIYTNTMY